MHRKVRILMKKYSILLILIALAWHWHLYLAYRTVPTPDEPTADYAVPAFVSDSPLKALSRYTKEQPASNAPLLEWSEDINAVYYQLELFGGDLPPNLSDREISPQHIFFTQQVYTHAYQIDLKQIAPEYLNGTPLYWRVRAMDIDGNPITDFSSPEPLYALDTPSPMKSPLPHVTYNSGNGTVLLYPVYSYVPNAGATQFEIEVTDAPPENPNGTEPSVHRVYSAIVTGGEHYDPEPRIGTYYWRVRGLDDDGRPVGVYCDARMIRNEPGDDWQIAIFGDSISHGGGHLSFGPADWAYSYAYYLDFPTINLSFSGDTSATAVERFDRDVLPFHPRFLLIMTGTNSLRAGVPADSVIDDLKKLQIKCRRNGITPILLTLAPINPVNIKKVFDEDTFDGWQESFAKVNDFIRTQPHIDAAAALNSPPVLPDYYAMDGLHGDVEAKKIYARAINENISRFVNAKR